MHLILSAPENVLLLHAELERCHPGARHEVRPGGWIATSLEPDTAAPPTLVFAQQWLWAPEEQAAASINAWSQRLATGIIEAIPEGRPWRLHLESNYGTAGAGENRCGLIRESLVEVLRRKRRHLLRHLSDATSPFTAEESLVQLWLTAPDQGLMSIALAPVPHAFRRLLSPFPRGWVPVASDQAAPSRAFAKLVESELRLGRSIRAGESCVDLGASPGSWSYVALRRGARVTAVDRSPLRDDLMRHPQLVFEQGDAFAFRPPSPVDWLLCDVIAAPERSIALLLTWLRERRARQFVLTIKFKGDSGYAQLDPLKELLPGLCTEFGLLNLCANKNEACAFGIVRPSGG